MTNAMQDRDGTAILQKRIADVLGVAESDFRGLAEGSEALLAEFHHTLMNFVRALLASHGFLKREHCLELIACLHEHLDGSSASDR